jgi:hypothetical protein
VLYGIDVLLIHNIEARLGRRMYDVRKELCEQLNLKSIILQDEFELRQIQRRNYTQDLY